MERSPVRLTMARRKGALSGSAIDRGWPTRSRYADDCRGTQYRTAHAFCRDLSLCPRGHSVFHGDEWWEVFCFADEAHAEAFRLRLGGSASIRRIAAAVANRRGGVVAGALRAGRLCDLAELTVVR